MFNKICIIGVGLIGGSIAYAARKQNLSQTIVGLGRESGRKNLLHAKKLGVIDDFYFDTKSAVQNADLIIIATPVGSFEKIFSELKPYWSKQAIYSDAGSTKVSVIAAAENVFGTVPDNFVPAHPIAGAEKSGVTAARADLFNNKRLILTPLMGTSASAVQKLRLFWQGIGSLVSIMDVDHHDAVLAATSHLPHILSYALVDLLGRKDEQVEIFKYAAGGFGDFTRIASSDPVMWMDICMANRDKLMPMIKQYQEELSQISVMLEKNESQLLFDTFTNAKKARQRFLDQFE